MTNLPWQMFGHDWAINLLREHVASDKLRHAYLLVGPQGLGRRTLALRFAQALNCESPPHPGEFCGKCKTCRQIEQMAHPDLDLLLPEEGHKDILIDQVRILQHRLALAPYMAPYRIALLLDFQRATTQAMNALLKTLEEPAEKVVLLLTADALENLLPTIVSRCEIIRLRPASLNDTQNFLQTNFGISSEKSTLVVHLTSGRVGAAIHLLESPDALSHRKEQINEFLNLLPAPRYERFKLAIALSRPYDKAREKAGEVIPIWLSFWRDVFVRASGADLPLVNVDLEEQVLQMAAHLSPLAARQLVISHEKALQHLDAYANVRLLLETLMLHWPQILLPVPKDIG